MASRVEQSETELTLLTDRLLARCDALARGWAAERAARLGVERNYAVLVASAGDAAESALEAARQRERAVVAEARAATAEARAVAAEAAMKTARWKLTMGAFHRARLESLARERDDALRASTDHAARAAGIEVGAWRCTS